MNARLRVALAAATTLVAAPAAADSFVLVHGAFQTAAAWGAVAERLEAAGQAVTAVDLPGRNDDGAAPGAVTMAAHVAAVRTAIEATGAAKVTLVGHSFGGMVISAVAEAIPERINELIYVAAHLPADGDSMQAFAANDHYNGFRADTFVVAPDYATATVLERDRLAIFAADAPADLGAAIAADLRPEPLGPMAEALALTPERFGAVRKAYVVMLRDHPVSTRFQLNMIGRGAVSEVIAVDAGHTPQIVAPEALADALLLLATEAVE